MVVAAVVAAVAIVVAVVALVVDATVVAFGFVVVVILPGAVDCAQTRHAWLPPAHVGLASHDLQ